ncbi:MAG: methyltransferase domain-containing protein [Acidobacteriota bacterium]|jgi:phospholipid N-methyltransferase
MTLRERIAFLGQMRAQFEHTGAVQPSSRYLAHAMAAPLRRWHGAGRGAARILEIGPGTGAVTRAVAAAMGPGDELVCYEINPEFARFLQQALTTDPQLGPVADRVRIHVAPAQQLDRGTGFDIAVCSAPLNNFGAETIDAILAAMMNALRPGGAATLFEYLLFPVLRRAFLRGDAARRLRAAEATKAEWLTRHGRGSVVVLRNLPPARVHELRATS